MSATGATLPFKNMLSEATATTAAATTAAATAKEKSTNPMVNDWVSSDKKQFLELRDASGDSLIPLTYKNKNPEAILQMAEVSGKLNGMILLVHFHNRVSEYEIKRISKQFKVTQFWEWNTRTGEPKHQYLSIPISSIRLETFLPIEQFLISKGFPSDLSKELRAWSFFRTVSTEEAKFYSTIANLSQQLAPSIFQQLLTFAITALKRLDTDNKFSQSVCSDFLYCLGEKCFQVKLWDFSYEALKNIAKENAYYYAAQFLMGQCLWAKFGADNSEAARKMKKQAFTHFYFASLEVEEAEGFLQMVLANLCDITTYNPIIRSIGTSQAPDDSDPVKTIIEKFFHLVDVCYNQSKTIQQQQTIIEKLKINSKSNNDDPSMHALTIQFNSMVAEGSDNTDDAKDSLKHKKRAVKKDRKVPGDAVTNSIIRANNSASAATGLVPIMPSNFKVTTAVATAAAPATSSAATLPNVVTTARNAGIATAATTGRAKSNVNYMFKFDG